MANSEGIEAWAKLLHKKHWEHIPNTDTLMGLADETVDTAVIATPGFRASCDRYLSGLWKRARTGT